jgi:hypothetical protein
VEKDISVGRVDTVGMLITNKIVCRIHKSYAGLSSARGPY